MRKKKEGGVYEKRGAGDDRRNVPCDAPAPSRNSCGICDNLSSDSFLAWVIFSALGLIWECLIST